MHRLAFFSSSTFGLPSLERLLGMTDVRLVAIVSQPARSADRNQQFSPTPVTTWATARHLPVLTPPTLRSSEAITSLRRLAADTYIVAAYGLILPPSILALPAHGCLNIHASLLPQYRGASPIATAIANGETTIGVSMMLMDAGIDTGPVLEQWPVPIEPDDTRPQLERRLAAAAAERLPTVFRAWWAGTVKPQPQSGVSSYAPLLRKEDGRAAWHSAAELERKIRAYQPWPGVWTMWRGRRLKLLSAVLRRERPTAPPGSIVLLADKPGWGIACQDAILVPQRVQMAGKTIQAAETLPGSYPGWIGSRCDQGGA